MLVARLKKNLSFEKHWKTKVRKMAQRNIVAIVEPLQVCGCHHGKTEKVNRPLKFASLANSCLFGFALSWNTEDCGMSQVK